MMKRFILILLFLGVLVATSQAMDLWEPPWDGTLPNQTYQAWDFSYLEIILIDENPYGIPELSGPMTWPDIVEGPDGTMINTLHIDEPGGLDIYVPNDPDPRKEKLIFWQVTSDKSPTPTGAGPSTNPPGTNLPSPYPQIQHGGTWYTYNGLISIQPNPEGELIHFDFLPSTNIEQIVIKTICIPEPSTLLVLGLGGLLIRRYKR